MDDDRLHAYQEWVCPYHLDDDDPASPSGAVEETGDGLRCIACGREYELDGSPIADGGPDDD